MGDQSTFLIFQLLVLKFKKLESWGHIFAGNQCIVRSWQLLLMGGSFPAVERTFGVPPGDQTPVLKQGWKAESKGGAPEGAEL